VSPITIVSDTPNCGITYDRHYDDHNSFTIQATGGSTCSSEKLVRFVFAKQQQNGNKWPSLNMEFEGQSTV
jgi:hypothetical protein